jgi:hypothetical protein
MAVFVFIVVALGVAAGRFPAAGLDDHRQMQIQGAALPDERARPPFG